MPRKRCRKKKSQGFRDRLRTLGFASYGEYLRGEHWVAFRARYHASEMTAKGCLACGSTQTDLHHTTYERLGSELLDDVVPLCRRHHHAVHVAHKKHRIPLGELAEAIRALEPGYIPAPRKKKAEAARKRRCQRDYASIPMKRRTGVRDQKLVQINSRPQGKLEALPIRHRYAADGVGLASRMSARRTNAA